MHRTIIIAKRLGQCGGALPGHSLNQLEVVTQVTHVPHALGISGHALKPVPLVLSELLALKYRPTM
eukprot:3948243-Amphidinium_carterae.1